jgi:hypothetical protein
MKINELLEAEVVVTTGGEANKLRKEFQALLKDVDVTVHGLRVSAMRANKLKGIVANTVIECTVTSEMKNDEYNTDEAGVALRLAHRLISRWLAQKKADGRSVIPILFSDVGVDHKFSTCLYRIREGSKVIDVPGFRVSVSIDNKEDTGATN